GVPSTHAAAARVVTERTKVVWLFIATSTALLADEPDLGARAAVLVVGRHLAAASAVDRDLAAELADLTLLDLPRTDVAVPVDHAARAHVVPHAEHLPDGVAAVAAGAVRVGTGVRLEDDGVVGSGDLHHRSASLAVLPASAGGIDGLTGEGEREPSDDGEGMGAKRSVHVDHFLSGCGAVPRRDAQEHSRDHREVRTAHQGACRERCRILPRLVAWTDTPMRPIGSPAATCCGRADGTSGASRQRRFSMPIDRRWLLAPPALALLLFAGPLEDLGRSAGSAPAAKTLER